MADNASLSLDEYIKKKKIRRPGNPNSKPIRTKAKAAAAIKKKQPKWNAKLRVSAKAGGAIFRRGRGGRAQLTRGNNKRRGFGFRRGGYNAAAAENPVATRYFKTKIFGRKARGGRLSLAARRKLLNQLKPGTSAASVKRLNNRNRGVAALRNAAKSRSLVVAQQRLKKARALLATRRRILGGTPAATSTVSGRILFSKYGLLTTQRRNAQANMLTIQEKIQRAQFARQQIRQQIDPILQGSIPQPRQRQPRSRASRNRPRPSSAIYSPPARAMGLAYQERESSVHFAPPSFYSGGGSLYSDQMSANVQPSQIRDRPTVDDSWVQRQRRVANNNAYMDLDQYGGGYMFNNSYVGARQSNSSISIMSNRFQREQPPQSHLDPEIQNRISHIQQAGRRRRDDPDKSLVIPDYRGPVTTSRMLIGERFKRLMR